MNRKDGKQEAECKWHNLEKQIKALLSEEPHCCVPAESMHLTLKSQEITWPVLQAFKM